jgi:alanine-glyoxylate transaminase/serine-glyoxylate transaminase/serine-pyruvate transaminase
MLARSAAQYIARRAPVAKAVLTSTCSSCSFSSTARSNSLDYGVISKEDFGTFKEYSVIHTDRSLNLMSDPFQRVMRDLNQLLKVTYNADKVVIIPGYVHYS